jgi:hypothetical protein
MVINFFNKGENMPPITQERILNKLETIYQDAVKMKKPQIALQVVMLQGKYIGLFDKRRFPDIKRIKEMSERELHDFVAVLKKHDPELEKRAQQEEMEKKPPLIPKHPPPCVCPECLSYE